MNTLYAHLGEGQLAILIIALSVSASLAALLAFQRLLPRLRFGPDSSEMGQLYGGAIGAIFSLIFALVIVADWQNYDRMSAIVDSEINVLDNLHQRFEGLPDALRTQAQAGLADYVNRVVEVEWPKMADAGRDPGTGRLLADLTTLLLRHQPAGLGDQAARQEMLQLLAQARGLRQDRVKGCMPYLDRPMWISLTVGSVILLGFACLLRMSSLRQHAIMQGNLGASIGVVFYLLLIYDQPFLGPGAISPAAMKDLPAHTWVRP
jgi:hypothetical protein